MDGALAPVCPVILITGAGGMFGGVLRASGIGKALADSMADLGIPVLLGCFLAALALRIAQGSATVALTTAAALMASCRCRRRLYRLAARLYRIGNGGGFGRLQPLQRLRLLAGLPPLGYGRTDHAENLDGQPNPHRIHRLCLVRTAVCHRLTDGKDSK